MSGQEVEGLVSTGRERCLDVGVDSLRFFLGVLGGVQVLVVQIKEVVQLRGPGQDLAAGFGVVD